MVRREHVPTLTLIQYNKRAKMVVTPLQENEEVNLGFELELSIQTTNGVS